MPLAMSYTSVTAELKLYLPGESMYIIGWYESQNSKVIIMSSQVTGGLSCGHLVDFIFLSCFKEKTNFGYFLRQLLIIGCSDPSINLGTTFYVYLFEKKKTTHSTGVLTPCQIIGSQQRNKVAVHIIDNNTLSDT